MTTIKGPLVGRQVFRATAGGVSMLFDSQQEAIDAILGVAPGIKIYCEQEATCG
jgi:hypothetical protein